MNKTAAVKKLGKLALNVIGVTSGGGSDKVQMLEARLALAEFKLAVAAETLEPFAAQNDDVRDILALIRPSP